MGGLQQQRRLLHPMYPHVGGDGGAIHLFEYILQRGAVHEKAAGQLVDGDPLRQVLHQILMHIADDLFLRCLKVHVFFRTGNLHDLLYDLMQQAALLGVRRFVVDLLALTAAFQKATVHQRTQMMGYGGAGHLQYGGDVEHTLLLMAQQPEDADAGGVAELLENVGYRREMPGFTQLAA